MAGMKAAMPSNFFWILSPTMALNSGSSRAEHMLLFALEIWV